MTHTQNIGFLFVVAKIGRINTKRKGETMKYDNNIHIQEMLNAIDRKAKQRRKELAFWVEIGIMVAAMVGVIVLIGYFCDIMGIV